MRSLLFAALVGCALAAPEPAHAQFGKLGNKIAKKAGVVPAGPNEQVKTGKVSFDEHVLEITDDRVSQLLKGLEAEKVMAARVEKQDTEGIERRNRAKEEAHAKQREAYDRKRETWEKCAEPEQQKAEAESEAQAKSLDNPAAMQKLQGRLKAAQAKGDMAEIRRITDSVSKVGMQAASQAQNTSDEMTAAIRTKCGEPPAEPADAAEPEPMLTFNDIRVAGIEASGLTDRQYAIMRERVHPFVVSKGKTNSGMLYTDAEAQVLAARLGDLSPYAGIVERY
jgi:hypothetical protein